MLTSAKVWGEEVKAVFDLYRYNLMEQIKAFNIKGNEREKWKKINWLFLYWRPLEEENLSSSE